MNSTYRPGARSSVMDTPHLAEAPRLAPYPLYYTTRTLCPVCSALVPGKTVARGDRVFLERRCPEHGFFEGLICSDREWYERLPLFTAETTRPQSPRNISTFGCPDDCGLCTAHTQIAGVLAIEITNTCNINCPCCITYNDRTVELTPDDVDRVVRTALNNQRSINTVTLTGGEPTIHPRFFEILDILHRPEIDYVSINTNGIRIASDETFVRRLAERKNIHVSLHYDGPHARDLRGVDHSVQVKAARRLEQFGVEMVPVMLVAKGCNAAEAGSIIDSLFTEHAMVKSVTVSLMAYTGENGSRFAGDPSERLTIPEALESIERSSRGKLRKADFIPLPMPNPLCTAISYYLYMDQELTPLFQFAELERVIGHLKNGHFATMTPEFSEYLRDTISAIYAAPDRWPGSEAILHKLRRLYQRLYPVGRSIDEEERRHIAAQHLRIVYLYQMMDSWSFDTKRLSRCSCQHGFADGRIIPTCAYYAYHQHRERPPRHRTEPNV